MKENKYTADEDSGSVSLCKKGDIDAFEILVRKHQKRMLNIAFRMIGNYEEACEVVQDAFVSAHKNIRKFEEKARFSTWLCTTVMNLSKNRIKQVKTRSYREELSMDDPVRGSLGSRLSLNIMPLVCLGSAALIVRDLPLRSRSQQTLDDLTCS